MAAARPVAPALDDVELTVGRLTDGRIVVSQRTSLGRSDVYLTEERARWVVRELAHRLDQGAFPRKAV